jgi:hypothetical protein
MANFGNYLAPNEVNRLRSPALGVGAIASLVILVAAAVSPDLREQALRSWLLGFIFWGGIGLGCLGILMLQYVTGGAWGVVSRRVLEAGSRTLPLIILLFIPLAIGVYTRQFYEWTHLPATEPIMVHRGVFMTTWFWIVRSAIYFAAFGLMVYLLNKWSARQDQTTSVEESRLVLERMSRFSGPMLVVYSLVVTFATVDWMLTLDAHWFSTIWGLLFVAGWALSCYSFVVCVLAWMSDKAPMDRVLGKRHFHDFGKLMLALTMVWAYFNFSQFLIIWAGNVPEETGWWIVRMKGGWGYIGAALIFFHFGFPFLVLLQQDFKRKARRLALLAIFILFMRLVDMFYLIGPSNRVMSGGVEQGSFVVSWMDIVATVAVGGLWLWWFFGELTKRPVVPIKDPYLEGAITHGRGH